MNSYVFVKRAKTDDCFACYIFALEVERADDCVEFRRKVAYGSQIVEYGLVNLAFEEFFKERTDIIAAFFADFFYRSGNTRGAVDNVVDVKFERFFYERTEQYVFIEFFNVFERGVDRFVSAAYERFDIVDYSGDFSILIETEFADFAREQVVYKFFDLSGFFFAVR